MNEISIYENEKGAIEVRLEQDTVWLSQEQMCRLFEVQKAAVSKHLKNIFDSGELDRAATVSKMETVQYEGKRKVKRNIDHFNLDAVISVGYRVNSARATRFRQWASRILREHLTQGYPTPDELWSQTFATQNRWRDRFATVPFEDRGGYFQGRYYQDIAVERVLEAIADNHPRILLTLATGTGKTFIAFQIAWKLFHSRWNLTDWKAAGEPTRRLRILFLADRNTLADQAYNAFSAFAEDALIRIAPDEIKKKGKVPKNGSIFFTIFQTFMSGPPRDGQPSPYFGEYPPDFFDFIVIDECHRGGANDESNWRGIMEYFAPAVQLGLTATPKRDDNVDTYAYFGDPVYIYSLKDGINDGYLTPFRVKQIATTLDEYIYTSDDNVVEGEIEAGKLYTEPDFNKIIEIKEREKKRVEIFMSLIDQREKTLVFCANQAHALAVRDLINQFKNSTDPNYCHRVTANDGALGEQHLRDFQDNEKIIPTILTTSQKLSTGVDARNIRNIVLMRPINKIIEFKQIIGRGTRLYDGKDYFTIYDFVKAHHHFSEPEWDGEPINEVRPMDPVRPAGHVETRETPPEYVPKKKARVKLADGKERTIQHMVSTSFWHRRYPHVGAAVHGSAFGSDPLLKLKYHDSIPDAVSDLGNSPLEIGQVFAGFQQYLYQGQAGM